MKIEEDLMIPTAQNAGDVTIDHQVDMAYVYVESCKAAHAPWGKVTSIAVKRKDGSLQFVIDTDSEGRLLGIEVFGVKHLGPDALARAIDITGPPFVLEAYGDDT